MQHALPLSNQRAIVIPLLACALGAAGATFTYAAVDGAFDGSSTGASAASTRPAPHAGVGATAVTPPPPAISAPAHKGGGPPAELSPAMEAAIAKRTDPHGAAAAAAAARSAER